jgi:hypothetical protein
MKTSVSKLLANRANALKSTGPKSQHGKHASSKNAHKHGLAGSLSDGERAPSLLNAELVNDARRLGYSHEDAVALIDALQTNCSVILAKHAAYAEKPIEDRMPNMSMEKIDELLGWWMSPEVKVTPRERRYIVKLLYKEVEKDNDSVRRLTLKIDAHRKLMRYEQRAVNRLRRAAKGQK